MNRAPKVLVVALDAMDPDLAFQWAERGELPALAALRDRAVWGPTRNPDGFYVNLEGREPHGRIRPGVEFDAYCEALARELLLLRNVASGGLAFHRVERCDDLYSQGSKLPLLPDLLAEWTRDAEFPALESPTIGRVEGRYRGVRTGDHRPHGLFLATGPGLTPRRVDTPVSVMDFGPTIAARLGVELGDVDGDPIPELLAGAID